MNRKFFEVARKIAKVDKELAKELLKAATEEVSVKKTSSGISYEEDIKPADTKRGRLSGTILDLENLHDDLQHELAYGYREDFRTIMKRLLNKDFSPKMKNFLSSINKEAEKAMKFSKEAFNICSKLDDKVFDLTQELEEAISD